MFAENLANGVNFTTYLEDIMEQKTEIHPDLLAMIRRGNIPNMMADLADVQPMDGNLLRDLLASASDEQELIKAGFEPVSEFGLLWTKKGEPVEVPME
jgi:hypothetical protein